MKKILLRSLLTLIFFLTISFCFSQSRTKPNKRTYTNEAIEEQIEGRVFVRFNIDKKGKIIRESVKVVNGLGYGLDELAIEAVRTAPDWAPPTKDQIKIYGDTIKFTVPVAFNLTMVSQDEWFDYYNWKGNALLKEKDYDNAIIAFNKGLNISSRNPIALYGLYVAYNSKGDSTNAKIYLDKSIKRGYKSQPIDSSQN
jgi:TonB family protein